MLHQSHRKASPCPLRNDPASCRVHQEGSSQVVPFWGQWEALVTQMQQPQASPGGQPSIGTHLSAEPASRGLVLASVPPRLARHVCANTLPKIDPAGSKIQHASRTPSRVSPHPLFSVVQTQRETLNIMEMLGLPCVIPLFRDSRLQAQCRTPEHKPGDGLGLKALCQLLSCCWWLRRQITAGPGHGVTTHLAARHHAAPSPRVAAPCSSSGERMLKIDHALRLHASATSLGAHLFSDPDPTSPIRTPEGGLHLSIFPRLIH